MEKLQTLSELGLRPDNPKPKNKPTIDMDQNTTEMFARLMKYALQWSALAEVRAKRARTRNYLLGRQWSDYVVHNGVRKTEEDYIKEQGRVPLVNNQIQQIANNIMGTYRQNPPKSILIPRAKEKQSVAEMQQNALEACKATNEADQLDAAGLREFLVSGAAISPSGYGYVKEKNKKDVMFDNATIINYFFNPDIQDIRMKDMRNIGRFIDMTIDKAVSIFSVTDGDDEVIRTLLEVHSTPDAIYNALTSDYHDSMDFFSAGSNDKVRVYECWELKAERRLHVHDPLNAEYRTIEDTKAARMAVEQTNTERLSKYIELGVPTHEIPLVKMESRYEEFWYFYYCTPSGHVLQEGESPFFHEEHPFTVTLHPLLDGEIRGFLYDLIDQQRYINRLIILIDFIISSSAKGVLLVPEDAIPDEMDIDDYAEEWAKFNGVVKIKAKPGAVLPQQITANNTNVGAFDLLAVQMNMMQKISGVSDAAQGLNAQAGTSGKLYAQQIAQSAVNIVETIKSYMFHLKRRDTKVLKNIIQFYEDKEYLGITGQTYAEEAKTYDPTLARSVESDVKVIEGTSTPVLRQMQDEFLIKLFEMQAISVTELLKNTSMPMSDKLLEQIEQREEAVRDGQGGQVGPGMDPAMIQEFLTQNKGQGNDQGQAMLQNALMQGIQ